MLGVSPSGLRRLASIYVEVHGELPRHPATQNRLWPVVAVERLQAARTLVEAGRARSVREALQLLEHEVDLSVELQDPAATLPTGEALGVLVEAVQALREELAEVRRDNAAVRRQLEETPSSGDSEELERIAVALERQGRQLGELHEENRRLREENNLLRRRPRPWWQFWD